MNNLLITMSGGTTSVINATLSGLVEEAQRSKKIDNIYAGFPGIIGVLENKLIDLTTTTKETLVRLYRSPGSASVGTTRIKILSEEELNSLRELFHDNNIRYFVNIGGNGTIKQTSAIANYIDDVSVAAAPKTVDNDLGDALFKELWYTPGFPSCANYWFHKMHMLNNENIGGMSHDKVLIAQTFGRETGFIVGSMRMYDRERKLPLLLLLPEDQRSPSAVIGKIKEVLDQHGRVIIGIGEGYKISDYTFATDYSGQPMYGSSRSTSAQELVNLCMDSGIQARSYNPTVDQRQNFEHTLKSDLEVSCKIGKEVIHNFEKGKSHFFQSLNRKPGGYEAIPLRDIGNYSRAMLPEWIDTGNWDVTNSYMEYLDGFMTPTKFKSLFVDGA